MFFGAVREEFVTYQRSGELIWSVAQLNRQVAQILDEAIPIVWVKGEVSNFTQAASGHWYFSIKDERAAVRAVMFRGRTQALGFVPKPGEQFEFRCTVTLYEPRGDYQVQVEAMRRAGLGDLHEAFLRLKKKLEEQGWFDSARKRAMPRLPRAVGVVTSLSAAALRDVLSVMARRAPHVPVIIYPAPVQGLDAPARLIQALQLAYQRQEVDAILLVRGGGSIEDLWAFNDEQLGLCIAASPVPLIAGVGHETDFTIADFMADVRAPTPTAAAELVCRSQHEWTEQLQNVLGNLQARMQRILERGALRLDRAMAMLVSPAQRIAQQRQRLEHATERLNSAMRGRLERSTDQQQQLAHRLARQTLDLRMRQGRLTQAVQGLRQGMQGQLLQKQQTVSLARHTLQALSPLDILKRGYAIVRDAQGNIVQNTLDLNVGERLDVELNRGQVSVSVINKHDLL